MIFILVGKNLIVVRSKSVLFGGALAGLGPSVRLRTQNGEMFVYIFHFAGFHIFFTKTTQRVGGETPAEMSFEVAVFNHGNRGIGIALNMARVGHHEFHQRGRGRTIYRRLIGFGHCGLVGSAVAG